MMLWLWLFWIEVVLFSGYMAWTAAQSVGNQPTPFSQRVLLVLYIVALAYGAYGFGRFVRRRVQAVPARK
jgi:hypothetical protein